MNFGGIRGKLEENSGENGGEFVKCVSPMGKQNFPMGKQKTGGGNEREFRFHDQFQLHSTVMYFNVDWFYVNNVKFVELRTYLTPCVRLKKLFSLYYERKFWDLYLDAQINTVKYLFFCDTMSAIRDDAWPSQERACQPSELYTVHWVSQSSLSSWEIKFVRWCHAWPGCTSSAVAGIEQQPECLYTWHVHRPTLWHRPANTNSRHSSNVVSMLGQRRCRWPNFETVLGESLVFAGRWGDCIIFLQICRSTILQSSHLPRKHEVEHVSVSMQIQSCYYEGAHGLKKESNEWRSALFLGVEHQGLQFIIIVKN